MTCAMHGEGLVWSGCGRASHFPIVDQGPYWDRPGYFVPNGVRILRGWGRNCWAAAPASAGLLLETASAAATWTFSAGTAQFKGGFVPPLGLVGSLARGKGCGRVVR